MIISIDPSGTGTTACFLFSNWKHWEFRNFTDKNWLNHVQFIKNLLQTENPKLIIYEDIGLLKFANYHFKNLLKVIAAIELIAQDMSIKNQPILAEHTKWVKDKIKQGKVSGCKYEKRKWYFQDKLLSSDEKDALLCFYIYWVKIRKGDWLRV